MCTGTNTHNRESTDTCTGEYTQYTQGATTDTFTTEGVRSKTVETNTTSQASRTQHRSPVRALSPYSHTPCTHSPVQRPAYLPSLASTNSSRRSTRSPRPGVFQDYTKQHQRTKVCVCVRACCACVPGLHKTAPRDHGVYVHVYLCVSARACVCLCIHVPCALHLAHHPPTLKTACLHR